MSVLKSVWASITGDPAFMRRLNGWLTIIWILMIPVSIFTGWISSVAYVSTLSLLALVSGHWSAWQAARVEVMQQEDAERRQRHPVEKRVVEAIVRETELNRNGSSAGSEENSEPQSGARGPFVTHAGAHRNHSSRSSVVRRRTSRMAEQRQ